MPFIEVDLEENLIQVQENRSSLDIISMLSRRLSRC